MSFCLWRATRTLDLDLETCDFVSVQLILTKILLKNRDFGLSFFF